MGWCQKKHPQKQERQPLEFQTTAVVIVQDWPTNNIIRTKKIKDKEDENGVQKEVTGKEETRKERQEERKEKR